MKLVHVSVKRSLFYMGMAQTASFACHFTSSIVLARYLTPAEMGIFAVGLASIAVLGVLQSFGLQTLIVREERLTRSMMATTFTINAASSVLQTFITIAVAPLGAVFLREDGVRDILFVLSVTPLIGMVSFLPGAQLERDGKFKTVALASACTSIIGSSATILFAVLGHNYMSLAYGNVIGAISLSILIIFLGRGYTLVSFGVSEWRRVYQFGVQMLAYASIVSLGQRICEIMLGRIAGMSALGLYNRASGINLMLWSNVQQLISRVMLVDFATSMREDASLRLRYILALSVMTGILWPAFAGLAMTSYPFIYLVYGAKWTAATVPLVLLAMSSIILISMTLSNELFAVTGRVATQTRLELIRNAISIPLFIGACFVSIEAAALTRLVDSILAWFLYRRQIEEMSGASLRDRGDVYLRSGYLTVAAVIPAAIVTYVNVGAEPTFSALILSVILGMVFWCGALSTIAHPLKAQLLSLSVLQGLRRTKFTASR